MAKNDRKLSKLEAAKEAALQAHLRDALANVTAPAAPSAKKRKRKPGPKNSLPVDSTGGESSGKLATLSPRMRGYQYFALGYSMASIARALDVSDNTIADWRDKDDWVARSAAAVIEADSHRAAQLGTIKDKHFVAASRVLDHVVDALDAVGEDGRPASYDAEELRDFATAAEKAAKYAYPQQNGVQVGVQVNLAEALEESRKLDYVKIVESEP